MPKAKKIAIGAILGALFLPFSAFADILFAQQKSSTPDTKTYCNYINAYSPQGEIAVTYAGASAEIGYISAIAHASTTQTIRLQIFQYTDPTWSVNVQQATVYATMLGTKGRVNWILDGTGMWLNATSSYRIIIGGDVDPNVAFYGSEDVRTDIYSYSGGVGGSWGSHCVSNFGMPWLEIGTDDAGSFFDASSVTNPATFRACSFSEISGCIANAFNWTFIPSTAVLDQFHSLTLASSSPFSYIYDVRTATIEFSQSGTTSIKFELPIFGRQVTIFDTASTTVYLGMGDSAVGTTTHNTINTLLQVVIALAVISYFYGRIKSLLSKHS